MRPRRFVISPGFDRALRRLTAAERIATQEAVRHFRDRTAENALRIERKSGLLGIWAFRVNNDLRVFFLQRTSSDGRYAELLHVGHHDDYRTIKRKV